MRGGLSVSLDGSVTFTVTRAGRDAWDGRDLWCWTIADVDGRVWSDADIRTGATGGPAVGALKALLSFAAACAEACDTAWRFSLPFSAVEGASLFPADCAELLCDVGAETIGLLSVDTFGEGGV